MDETQRVQNQEYGFPYHYLPTIRNGSFSSYRAWDWSLQYVTALTLVQNRIAELNPGSHVDIGCGDGALIAALTEQFPDIDLVGIDYDRQAIMLAGLMAPNARFLQCDIINAPPALTFDSGSLVEVFEHIPPELGDDFLRAVKHLLKPGATLIMTVPHRNQPLIPKHYRHFTFDMLRQCVAPHFEVRDMFAFEYDTLARKIARRLTRDSLFIESQTVNRYLLREQVSKRGRSEDGFMRIYAELTPKA